MGPFVFAAWFASPTPDPVAAYVATARHGGRAASAYELVAGGEHIRDISTRLERIDPAADLDTDPTHLAVADVASIPDALGLRAALAGPGEQPLTSALFARVATYHGKATAPSDGFAPAIQLGTFSMPTADDDWAIAEWYEQRRMPAFCAMEGAIRSSRLVTVAGGLARMGVFYEYASMEARNTSFERIEQVDHDPSRPTAAARTIHPRMSPSIGARMAV